MIAVVFGGRPLILEEIVPYFEAILFVFMPGTEAGNAIANVLYGEVNPSGKLSMSFPRNVGQLPLYYNQLKSGRPKKAMTLCSKSSLHLIMRGGMSRYIRLVMDSVIRFLSMVCHGYRIM